MDLIPITWGIEIPEDMVDEAEAFFAKLTERGLCRCFVTEDGKHVMEHNGKRQVCLTMSVTPKDYIDGIPPHLIRKLFDNVIARQAIRESAPRIYRPN